MKHYSPIGRRKDLCRDFWIRETGTGRQVAQQHDRYMMMMMMIMMPSLLKGKTTNRKVAGSIPAGVSGFFIDIKSFRSHYGPGVDSTSNRNEYQEYFLGVKVAGA